MEGRQARVRRRSSGQRAFHVKCDCAMGGGRGFVAWKGTRVGYEDEVGHARGGPGERSTPFRRVFEVN